MSTSVLTISGLVVASVVTPIVGLATLITVIARPMVAWDIFVASITRAHARPQNYSAARDHVLRLARALHRYVDASQVEAEILLLTREKALDDSSLRRAGISRAAWQQLIGRNEPDGTLRRLIDDYGRDVEEFLSLRAAACDCRDCWD